MKDTQREMKFNVSARYLILPIQNEGEQGNLKLHIDGDVVLDYDLILATGQKTTDWHAFFDISRFTGKRARVTASHATAEGFAFVKQDDVIPGEETFYHELLRPQFHFTAKTGWLNDPNGLIYYKGEYHMYYQHNPVATVWGNMTWGHAVSRDLVHWIEQPKALFPNSDGTCFSGAAFVDWKNQLGRKSGDEDVLVMFYLRTKVDLCFSYSNDRGRTMTDYEHNPVLTHEGARIDTPRPFWYEPTKRWIAPTYDFFTNTKGEMRRCVGIYSSKNLTDWSFESRVEQDGWGDELCGCVDLFQLPVDGDPDGKKWVLIFVDGSYIVGTFDGHIFYTLAGKPADTDDRVTSLVIPGNYYATQTWHDMPDDRRVQITWMRSDGFPGMPFSQQMSVPSELTLHSTDEGPRLHMNPVPELKSLRVKTHRWQDVELKAGQNPLADLKADLFDLEVEFEPSAGSKTVFNIRGLEVLYDLKSQTLISCGQSTTLKPVNGMICFRILVDRISIEVYGNDGRVYLPTVVFPEKDNFSLSATCRKGEVKAHHLRVHELISAWNGSDGVKNK